MNDITSTIHRQFGDKLRIRVCGLLLQEKKVLLVKHKNIGESSVFWAPPGGGLQFGETMEDCLKREFLEETNLQVDIGSFLGISEYLDPPLHAIEIFYEVKKTGGTLQLGHDPELSEDEQIIEKVGFISQKELDELPKLAKHQLLRKINVLKLNDEFGKI